MGAATLAIERHSKTKEHSVCRTPFRVGESIVTQQRQDTRSIRLICLLTAGHPVCCVRCMSVSDRELMHRLNRMPLVDTAELVIITGEAHVTVHRG